MNEARGPVIVVGNWKMYKTIDESVAFVKEFLPLVNKATAKAYLAVPFTSIKPVADMIKKSNVVVGAQNMNDATEGAFTGEIAASMLIDAKAQFVILGHSERRRIFHEDNAFINRKVKRAVKTKLQPILCIGETVEERTDGRTEQVLHTQIKEGLKELKADQLERLILAYEPVWAIGTDETATPEIAQQTHALCRAYIAKLFDSKLADQIRILYGGSVKPNNARELVAQPDVDGLLVGSASLSAQSFSEIVNTFNQ